MRLDMAIHPYTIDYTFVLIYVSVQTVGARQQREKCT